VLRAGDNLPLRKVVLTLMLQGSQSGRTRPQTASTDAEGKFFFKDVKPGRYMLAASRTGYARQMFGQRAPNAPGGAITVAAGQRLTDVVIRLTPGAVITGRVLDEDGEPLSGVRVQALRFMYPNGRRELAPVGNASTDDRGEYRIFSLTPGRYFISAVYGGGYPGGGGFIGAGFGDAGQEAYAPTYYPGVNDVSQAAPLEVRPGDEIPGINLRLIAGRAVRVSGRLRTANGEPARGVSVNMIPRGLALFRGDQKFGGADEQGNFEIRGIMPGSYSVIAQSYEEKDKKRTMARVDVEVGNTDVEGVLLTLRPGVEIPGQVRLDSGADLKNSHLRLFLAPRETTMGFGGGGSGGEVKPDLSFALTDVADGDYTVRVVGLSEELYVRSIRLGGRDVLNDGLSVRGRGGLLEISLSSGASQIDGQVNDDHDQPFTGARVVLVPDESHRSRSDLFHSSTTDQYGHFSIRGIPPGKYSVFAWESLDEGAYQDPEFLRAYQDLGKSVEVESSSRVTQDLKLISAAKSGM
jgi:protocatechuate 3,4-dioxygenase beta subunit